MDVETLLNGSARIDQMRKEINAVVTITLGFLTEADKKELREQPETLVKEFDWYGSVGRFTIKPDGRKFIVLCYFGDQLICMLPIDSVPIKHVGHVRGCLNEFLSGISSMFSSIREGWKPIWRADMEGQRVYFELGIKIPSEYGSEEIVRYRKAVKLEHIPPKGAEIHFSIEGDPTGTQFITIPSVNIFNEPSTEDSNEGVFFTVKSYEGGVSEVSGDLNFEFLIVYFELAPDWEDTILETRQNIVRLLNNTGWQKQ